MRTLVAAWAVVVLLAASASVAGAQRPSGHFHAAPLEAEQEVQMPAVVSDATGVAQFWLSEDGSELRYRLNVANIDEVVQAHIHLAPAGVNGGIVAFLFGPVTPGGRVQGVLATGTITAGDLIGPLAGQPLSALISAMEAGNTYVNVHTATFPMGEIRGQIE